MKSVVITGGSKGIGLEIAKYFLEKGDYYVVVGARSKIKNKILKNKNFKFINIDASLESSHKKLAKQAIKKCGKLDIYINNAGFSEWRPIKKIDLNFLNKIINTNLISYFWGCKIAINCMSSGGSIINISSIAGKRGSKNNSAYSATKFAINGLTQSLSKEIGINNIRINAICPVLVKTPGLLKALISKHSPAKGSADKFLRDFTKSQTALNRLPTALEIAKSCYYLSSNEASAITGQCINVDCGVFPQ